jgi:hypothetical protein
MDILSVPHVTVADFWLMYVFGNFVKNHMAVTPWFYFWVLNSIPLLNISVLVPVPCYFCYYGSVI